jgi:hypothetical protein
MLRFVSAALVVALATAPARAADTPRDDRQKHHGATRTNAPPEIDGSLDDPAWREARVDDRFTQNFPDEAKRPSQRTELRVLFDDRALYIGLRMFDDHPEGIVERLTRRDRDTDADKVAVEISSKNDRTTAYEFVINVSGVLADAVRFNDTDWSSDWDGLWLGAAKRDAQGWTAEYMIPLKTLRYEGGRSEFGFQVRRLIQRRQEIDEWAYTPRAARGEVSYYGVLDGLTGLRATRLFQIVPYLAGGIYLRYNQSPDALNGTSLYGNIGADLKLGLTPALTLDVTLNPDFGQVEADQVFLNLSTFELFYPEKRPFFLEGVDIFATPLALFYSRRIGRQPPEPDPSTFNQLEWQGPSRIYAAAKVSGLVTRRLTIGVLDAVTAESSTVVSRVDGTPGTLRVSTQPLTNFAVLRLKRDILARSFVGVMATATTRFEQPFAQAPQPGDLCPSGDAPSSRGRCTHDGYTGAVDWNLRTSDGDWGVLGQAAATVRVAGPSHTIADGTVLAPSSSGVAVGFFGGKFNGKYTGQLDYNGSSPAFDPNDLGFNRQGNAHFIHPTLHYRILKPVSIVQEGDIQASAFVHTNWDFSVVSENVYWLGAFLRFKNFWSSYFEIDYAAKQWDLREARDGAAVERVDGWWVFFTGKTDPRKRLWVATNGSVIRTAHGRSADVWMQIALRPKPAIEIDVLPHLNWTFGDPRWFDTRANGDGTNTYYFADLDSRDFDVTLRGTYTFSPTLTLQAYAQLFLAGGHYGQTVAAVAAGKGTRLPLSAFRPTLMPSGDAPDFRNGAINLNIVLRWEFRPGSTLLGVYTHAQTQTSFDAAEGFGRPSITRFSGGAGTDLFLLKLSLLLI